jgi:hypothetical protein
MPNISNLPNKKSKQTKKKLTNSPLKTKTPKSSPIDYYNCLLTSAQQGWQDPSTGQKKKITACCQDCKTNAPALTKQRKLELHKLITSYRQVGESLSKLLQPLKK